ncbi:hypothetical protein JW877_07520 [bacterium]|nr:hypothetical protein [bacterium]
MDRQPSVCLINPWITDFAAYDLWSKPLGLLYINSFLKSTGFRTRVIDCQSYGFGRFPYCFRSLHPPGRGHIRKQKIPKPPILNTYKRDYFLYGIHPKDFEYHLGKMASSFSPDLFLLTSQMTYWYPGIKYTIEFIRNIFPRIPVLIGGLYATLLTSHAQNNFSDCIILPGNFNQEHFRIISQFADSSIPAKVPSNLLDFPYPFHYDYPTLDVLPLLTSLGCPHSCSICASRILNPVFHQKAPGEVVKEIVYYIKNYKIKSFAFYDDALLSNADKHIIPIMEGLLKNRYKNMVFYVPNGLEVANIDASLAKLLYRCGFRELRLSFEGLNTSDIFNKPLNLVSFCKAVGFLIEAGFSPKDLRAYILVGHPLQKIEDILESVYWVHSLGIRIDISHYALVPGTPGFDQYSQYTDIDPAEEPLFHNNTLWNWRLKNPYPWEKAFRKLVNTLNRAYREGEVLDRTSSDIREYWEECINP